ncbi:hypothetical protein A1O3_09977 [Capronia epimyces CBS 606.96]|uniref:Histidine kinase n=1 Tax=Capronia epimyces CBS 606.96 TaxID=1182542 RepID=W9XBY8_9EURO|nr:uncharacterized protein A1O3_09977 [Capronia epimyces CBS 606.96]EXJ77748.1 hypothetical protein A1O3_09977 [Capronia epimyces CBS 606.96]
MIQAHHNIQGRPFKEVWKDVWSDLGSFYHAMRELKHGVDKMDLQIFAEQPDGRKEETFWNGTLLPIRGENGHVAGFYNRATETTNERVNERRSNTLYAISSSPDHVSDSIWQHVFQALGQNEQDFPMAFAYSAEDSPSSCILTLQESLGLPPDGNALVPPRVDIYGGSTGFPFYYRKVKATHKPLILHKANGSLPDALLDGFVWRGYGERPVSMVLIPVSVSSRLIGILVFGWNPRRRYRPEDDVFVNALCRQVSATISFAIDREEAYQRAERMTLQLADRERQIREIAEHGPVGMIRLTPDGNIVWANSQFYAITSHSIDDQYEYSFTEVLHPDDREMGMEFWYNMVDQHKSSEQEFRLNRTWIPPPTTGNPKPQQEYCWILSNAFPVIENGIIQSVVACVTDISRTKWAEEVQSRLAIEATEARKLQEAFIDVVSHEMRNPLSAITQLADGIAASLDGYSRHDGSIDATLEILGENVENAKTILLCAAHQKRIIDDVLTLSKLDSQLLSITPVVVQPQGVVESALTMFRAEFDRNAISVENIVDEMYTQCGVDRVSLDPSRLTQIFINLLTNAIKFTKTEQVRKITIRRSAFIHHPPPPLDGIKWFPSEQARKDITSSDDCASGDPVYLLFSVSDTGKGMEPEEMARLFHRFQQGTEKTHIKYGGSGLGLFVSRELTENMGGEIGVASTPGKGSTFAFYIKTHKAPPEPAQILQGATSPATSRRPSLSRQRTISRSQKPQTTLGTEPAPIHVLLVEDNVINAQVLTRQLERMGCTIYTANHGAQALDLLPQLKAWRGPDSLLPESRDPSSDSGLDIDCILMDVEMPVLDGLSCTRRIRELQQQGRLTRHIPIIAITANARVEQIEAAFEAGVDAVLPKPFRAIDVLSKIDELMSLDALRRLGIS